MGGEHIARDQEKQVRSITETKSRLEHRQCDGFPKKQCDVHSVVRPYRRGDIEGRTYEKAGRKRPSEQKALPFGLKWTCVVFSCATDEKDCVFSRPKHNIRHTVLAMMSEHAASIKQREKVMERMARRGEAMQ